MMGEILSERSELMEPNVVISCVMKLRGSITAEEAKVVIEHLYEINETTMSRIVIAEEGRAYFEKMEHTGCQVQIVDGSWQELLQENQKRVFALEQGESIRTILIPEGNALTILMLSHHLAGDGKAVCAFVKQLFCALDGEAVKSFSMDPVTKAELERCGKLPGYIKRFLSRQNRKWRKEGRVFNWEDYKQIHKKYWETHEIELQFDDMDADQFERLHAETKKEQISMNSYLIAELQKEVPQCRVIGIPVSFRNGKAAMNNMTTGIQVRHAYRQEKSVMWNAKRIHKKVQQVQKRRWVNFLALTSVAELSGSLIDGILMQTHQLYDSKLTRKMCKVMLYTGKNKTQLGVTNLGVIEIPSQYQKFQVEQLFVIPPKVSYADEIVGISTFHNRICKVWVREKNMVSKS